MPTKAVCHKENEFVGKTRRVGGTSSLTGTQCGDRAWKELVREKNDKAGALLTASLRPKADMRLKAHVKKHTYPPPHDTMLKGGSMLLSLPQIESASVRGPEDDVKLQPGAVVTISLEEGGKLEIYGSSFQFGFIASSALIAPWLRVGSDLISYNPNPMQAIATVEAVTQDTADVLVPGVYMQDLNERIRLTEQGEGWYRANVDRDIMAAHVTSRNFHMATDLADIRNDVCLLWPEPLVPADVTFVNASTGATLTEQLGKAAGVRRLIDEDVHLLVHGRRVQFLDPTLCVMPAVENVKGMMVACGGCFAGWLGFANLGYPFDALSLTGIVVSMSMPYLWNRIWRYLPGATKSKFVADPRAGAKRVVEKL